jgi:fructosamine-3-kinase
MEFEDVIEKWLEAPLLEARPLSGGDINQVFRLRLANSKEFVLKLNSKDRYPGMFEKESAGLGLLKSAGCRVPGVELTFVEGAHQFLILEYVEEGRPIGNSWELFGRQLATLHLQTNESFGLDHDNYIGSLDQMNGKMENWTEFFISNRLKPLIRKAKGRNLLGSKHLKAFESLFSRLPELIPREAPSLLHGDLWSGNLMFDKLGEPVFIDPAVYFGHREVDIAMTRMFGGFNESFLVTYNEILPLEKGWEERIELHNLYPTLVHLVLFGSSYLSGIERTLRRFAS